MNWILALYSNATVQVKVNGLFSRPFVITNGTRQGCSLSPLLFALSMEPFLQTSRCDPDIHGLRLLSLPPQKIAAYADDLLFFISQPHT